MAKTKSRLAAIKEREISISLLAKRAKVSRATVYGILNGTTKPTIITLVELGAVLRVDLLRSV